MRMRSCLATVAIIAITASLKIPQLSKYCSVKRTISHAVARQPHGVAVGFPMQTADGEIIFAVGQDFTLTADQILELLERGELHAEGVRRSVEAQASGTHR
jgi:hypothetical protein